MTMSETKIFRLDGQPTFDRGNGVQSTLLAAKKRCGAKITTGITRIPAGMEVPMHSHNCAEHVTLLDGQADVEIEGERTPVRQFDTTYIKADQPHRFINTGSSPLAILWVYDTDEVTRTFTKTGETVPHLSDGDKVSALLTRLPENYKLLRNQA